MPKSYSFLKSYKSAVEEYDDGYFGNNCEFDFLRAFKKLEDLGVKFICVSSYTVEIECDTLREDGLWFLITGLPGASKSVKNNSKLILEWFFPG